MSSDPARARLGEAVRRARLDKNWGKEAAARAAGISSITWGRVEAGESVQDVKLAAVSKALGWDPDAAYRLMADAAAAEHLEQPAPEPVVHVRPMDLFEAIDAHPDLVPAAKAHLKNQVELLLTIQEASAASLAGRQEQRRLEAELQAQAEQDAVRARASELAAREATALAEQSQSEKGSGNRPIRPLP